MVPNRIVGALLETVLSAMDKVGKMPPGKWQDVMALLSAPPISILHTKATVDGRFRCLMSC